MSKKFSISEGMLNGISKNVKKVEEIEAKDNFKVEYIDIENIKRNEKNFYEIVDVEELAEDIKLNGLNHNLVVRKLDNGQFELISGERRYTALSKLVKEGNKTFALVPCKVIEANDTDAEIILIQANAQTRELTEVEKLKQVQRLKELYKDKKAKGEKVPGKIREIIANDLKLSPTQVGRYEKINSSLIPELKNTKSLSFEQQKEKEGELILKALQPGDVVVLLDEHGKEFRSIEFANWVERKMHTVNKRLVFIIGGPYGFAQSVYDVAQEKISLSKMTFSHQMIRLIFVEQMYRAMTILNNGPYHHE